MKPPADAPDPALHLAAGIRAVSLLEDPVRRRVYFYLLSAAGTVDRDAVASDVGISRNLAAFHLDKLAERGLLDITYKRVNGRSGRGAGRPRKLYRRSSDDVSINLPQRDYELMAQLFAGALESGRRQPLERLSASARANGVELGRAGAVAAGSGRSSRRMHDATLQALVGRGFEPYLEGGDICMRNCPFDALARDHRTLVCAANHALLTGLVEGLGAADLTAVLEPADGRCCVVLRQVGTTG